MFFFSETAYAWFGACQLIWSPKQMNESQPNEEKWLVNYANGAAGKLVGCRNSSFEKGVWCSAIVLAAWRPSLDVMTGQFDWLCAGNPAPSTRADGGRGGGLAFSPSRLWFPLCSIGSSADTGREWEMPHSRDPSAPRRRPLASQRLNSHPGCDSLINCGMLWFMSIFSAWLMGQQVALPCSYRGNIVSEVGGTMCVIVLGSRVFVWKWLPPWFNHTSSWLFLNRGVAVVIASEGGLWKVSLLKRLSRLMHNKEPHALILVRSGQPFLCRGPSSDDEKSGAAMESKTGKPEFSHPKPSHSGELPFHTDWKKKWCGE